VLQELEGIHSAEVVEVGLVQRLVLHHRVRSSDILALETQEVRAHDRDFGALELHQPPRIVRRGGGIVSDADKGKALALRPGSRAHWTGRGGKVE
jgi:hypothetical protein